MSASSPVEGTPSSTRAEQVAELMAQHGMARYADPEVIAAWVDRATARGSATAEGGE